MPLTFIGRGPRLFPSGATFDPNNIGNQVTLSNANLTAHSPNGPWQPAYSTGPAKGGKRYFEGLFVHDDGSSLGAIGFAGAAATTAFPLGQDSGAKLSWGYSANSIIRYNDTSLPPAIGAFSEGDTVMVAMDWTQSPPVLYAGKNGTWGNAADPVAGTGGNTLTGWLGGNAGFSGVSCNGDTWTGNFGASIWLPAGWKTMSDP